MDLLPVCSQTVTLKVAMMCGGCENAVRRVLTKMPGLPRPVQAHTYGILSSLGAWA